MRQGRAERSRYSIHSQAWVRMPREPAGEHGSCSQMGKAEERNTNAPTASARAPHRCRRHLDSSVAVSCRTWRPRGAASRGVRAAPPRRFGVNLIPRGQDPRRRRWATDGCRSPPHSRVRAQTSYPSSTPWPGNERREHDLELAAFSRATAHAGDGRIIYVAALGDDPDSEHLVQSRQEVGAALGAAACGRRARAAVVLGGGSIWL